MQEEQEVVEKRGSKGPSLKKTRDNKALRLMDETFDCFSVKDKLKPTFGSREMERYFEKILDRYF